MGDIRNFVFSSVGNNTNFDSLWTGSNMNYDIYVIYYGDNEEIYQKYKSAVKYIEKRKGSKFQNFKYFYDNYINIIQKYDRFFILDDDIIFKVKDINKMFDISKNYNLDICGPSFKKGCQISHSVTQHKPNTLLTYTNFVEVNVPLFNKKSIHNLMKKIDYTLIGWGIDFLYIYVNGMDKRDKYAIIHCVTCINPKSSAKPKKKRELTLVKNWDKRSKIWEEFAKKHNIPVRFPIINFKNIPLPKLLFL